MCGRFTITADRLEFILKRFQAKEAPGFEGYRPRFNVAPGQTVPALVAREGGERLLMNILWGFIPPWREEEGMSGSQANIRDDTIAKNSFFRDRLQRNRCLFVADGFYEWQKPPEFRNLPRGQRLPKGVKKTPYRILMKDKNLFALAGLWRTFKKEDKTIVTGGIITTGPNGMMSSIHDRMPVILADAEISVWLDPGVDDVERLHRMLDAYPEGEMEAYIVSDLVNSGRVDSPACIEPVR